MNNQYKIHLPLYVCILNPYYCANKYLYQFIHSLYKLYNSKWKENLNKSIKRVKRRRERL